MQKNKILIVDDHPIIREGLAQLINKEEDMICFDEAGDAKEALDHVKKNKPDLAIIDISLNGISGIELTKSILSLHPEMPILMISLHEESFYLDRVLKAGAKGYLMKQEATRNFVVAIRKILKGGIYVSDKMKDELVNHLSNGSVTNPTAASSESLSDRELEILQLISQSHTTRQIADELYVSIKTVESHYANIKHKLNLKNSLELSQYAVKWHLSENN